MCSINEKATIKNADKFLKGYGRYKRMESTSSVLSKEALNYLDEHDIKILEATYFCKNKRKITDIYVSLFMSESKYYRDRNKALLHFAEAYNKQELIIFN